MSNLGNGSSHISDCFSFSEAYPELMLGKGI